MFHVAHRELAALLLALTTFTSGPVEARQLQDARIPTDSRPVIQRHLPDNARAGTLPFARTELYFGTARPDGVVSDAQFRAFVDRYVTPRFPDGLTLLKGDGQFRGADDQIVKEQSFVLILLYPFDSFDTASTRIERIRTLYKEQFDQESVLRVDDPFIVWVSF